MEFEELEDNIKKYLLLADRGIIKLLCACVIANRMVKLDPTWLFIVSSSSGGKSELLLALSYAGGTMPKDDLTTKTFISGAKNGGKETSLLFRMPDHAILVIKDLTVLLSKFSKDSAEIFSQLRMIYDGTFSKSFGTGEDIDAKPRMGLIAGTTPVIEDFQADDAAVGQRAIKYYMKQPPDKEIDDVTEEVLAGKQDHTMREMMGASFSSFLDKPEWIQKEGIIDVPDLPKDVIQDLAALSGMATLARSSVKRRQYDREQRIERVNMREMPFRFAKQLSNLAKAMMVINKGSLTGLDKSIIYQVALDSIPSERKRIMMVATRFGTVALDGLSGNLSLPEESVKIHLDDLVALGVMVKKYSGGATKNLYTLRDNYRELMSRFEHIEMTDEILEDDQEELKQPQMPKITLPTAEEQALIGF